MADFRCEALPQVCAPEVDAPYATFFNLPTSAKMGKITPAVAPGKLQRFSKDRGVAKCHACATQTAQRICPKCHGNLPKTLATGPHFPVAVVAETGEVGHRYLASLQHQLDRFGAHDLEARLESFPDISGFALVFDKKILGHAESLTLSFHCVGQDELKDAKTVAFLRETHGVIYLHDGHVLFQEMAPEGAAFEAGLKQILTAFKGMPLALGFNHLENWGGLLPKGSILNAYPAHDGGYDGLDGQAVSKELFAYMGATFGTNLLRHVRADTPLSRCFGLSLEKNTPHALREYARVSDILLWLLKTWKVL